jgi:hypothetical protein
MKKQTKQKTVQVLNLREIKHQMEFTSYDFWQMFSRNNLCELCKLFGISPIPKSKHDMADALDKAAKIDKAELHLETSKRK